MQLTNLLTTKSVYREGGNCLRERKMLCVVLVGREMMQIKPNTGTDQDVYIRAAMGLIDKAKPQGHLSGVLRCAQHCTNKRVPNASPLKVLLNPVASPHFGRR